jgi:hypothetical protein
VPVNSVAVRMRVPPGVPAGAVATLTFDGGPPVRLPSSCNGRSNCRDAGGLVNDGKWHTYTANLASNPGFADKTFTGFKFSPSDKPYDSGDPLEGIEVDYIRMAYLPAAGDTDQAKVACSECGKLPDSAVGKACTMLCQGHAGSDRVVVDEPDGFLDSEDNCPTTFNPLQEDGDGNGIGDACEDFDADGTVNSWDNCPTSATRASAIRMAMAGVTSATRARQQLLPQAELAGRSRSGGARRGGGRGADRPGRPHRRAAAEEEVAPNGRPYRPAPSGASRTTLFLPAVTRTRGG